MNKRIQYIDALRGLTMILVVFAHVETMGFFHFSYFSPVGKFFQLFRMPLFFFISGFIAYKAGFLWNVKNTSALVFKKLKVQIIPTLFWGSLFTILFCGSDFNGFAMTTEKYGYWFTISLLEMFLIYYLVSIIVSSSKWRDAILILIALVLFAAKVPMKSIPALNAFGGVTSMHYTCTYFQFFVFGNLMSKYRNCFFKALDNRYISAVIILVMMVLSYSVINNDDSYLFRALAIISGYLGICIVFNFFRKHEEDFSSSTRIGRGLQYIGKRTLDVYLLHYFFIPDLSFFGQYLQGGHNLLIELLIGFAVSVAIVALCLLISNIIRLSPLLANYLFGVTNIEKRDDTQ